MSRADTPPQGGPDPRNGGIDLTEDEIFEVLSNQRRRYAFHYLRKHEGEKVTLRELAEQVAAWETGKPIAKLHSRERKRVRTALHQFHLPKMDDLRFIEYDGQRGEVTLAEETADLDIYLDIVPGVDVPWGLYYACLTGFNLAVLAGVWLEIGPLSSFPPLSWAAFFVVAYGVSAVVHAYWNYRQTRFGVGERPPNGTADRERGDDS